MTKRHSSSKTVPFHAHVTKGCDEIYGSANYGVSFYEGAVTGMGFRYRKDAEKAAERLNEKWGGEEIETGQADLDGLDGVYWWYQDTYVRHDERTSRPGVIEAFHTTEGIIVNIPDLGDISLSDADAQKLIDTLHPVIDEEEV